MDKQTLHFKLDTKEDWVALETKLTDFHDDSSRETRVVLHADGSSEVYIFGFADDRFGPDKVIDRHLRISPKGDVKVEK